MKDRYIGMVLGLVLGLFMPSLATAQGSLASQEASVPGGTLMMISYLILWLMVGGYAFLIARRQRRLQGEIEGLDARIDEVFGDDVFGDEERGE